MADPRLLAEQLKSPSMYANPMEAARVRNQQAAPGGMQGPTFAAADSRSIGKKLADALLGLGSKQGWQDYAAKAGTKPQYSDEMVNQLLGAITPMGVGSTVSKFVYPIDGVVSNKSLIPPHEIRDYEKLKTLTASMKANGWQHRPILVYNVGRGNEALTGSHRIAAAKAAGIEVPIYKIDPSVGNYADQAGKSIVDISREEIGSQIKWLKKFGDQDAVKILKEEP